MNYNYEINKYFNKQTKIDGILFSSKKEALRYAELKLLESAGEISDIKIQPKFLLQDGFFYQKKKERSIIYIADFSYIEGGKEIIEDCKGMKTEVYKLKRKLLLYKYPTINFRET